MASGVVLMMEETSSQLPSCQKRVKRAEIEKEIEKEIKKKEIKKDKKEIKKGVPLLQGGWGFLRLCPSHVELSSLWSSC
jgi:hypothetical protein